MTAEKASLYKTEHIEKKKRKRYGLRASEYMEQKALENAADANDLLHDIEDEIADLEPKLKVAKEEVEKVEEESTGYYASIDKEQRREFRTKWSLPPVRPWAESAEGVFDKIRKEKADAKEEKEWAQRH